MPHAPNSATAKVGLSLMAQCFWGKMEIDNGIDWADFAQEIIAR